MPSQKPTRVIIVSQKPSHNPHHQIPQQQQLDPLLQQLQQMKITSNLVKQINFNSAANKFQYLQLLLSDEYKQFSQTINQLSSRQKQIVNNKIRKLHRDIVRISTQVQKQKEPNSRNLLANKSQLLDLHKRAQTVIETRKSAQKFLKLSEGMLNAVSKMEKQLDQYVKGKIEELDVREKQKLFLGLIW